MFEPACRASYTRASQAPSHVPSREGAHSQFRSVLALPAERARSNASGVEISTDLQQTPSRLLRLVQAMFGAARRGSGNGRLAGTGKAGLAGSMIGAGREILCRAAPR